MFLRFVGNFVVLTSAGHVRFKMFRLNVDGNLVDTVTSPSDFRGVLGKGQCESFINCYILVFILAVVRSSNILLQVS